MRAGGGERKKEREGGVRGLYREKGRPFISPFLSHMRQKGRNAKPIVFRQEARHASHKSPRQPTDHLANKAGPLSPKPVTWYAPRTVKFPREPNQPTNDATGMLTTNRGVSS